MQAGIRWTAVVVVVALAAAAGWRAMQSSDVARPEARTDSGSPEDATGTPASRDTDAGSVAAIDAEAHQAGGRAEPGAAPSGDGEVVRAADGKELGRLWRAAGPGTLVATWAGADEREGDALEAWSASLRRTRDYHLLSVRAEGAVGLTAALEAALALLGGQVSASALVASGDRAWPAVQAAAHDRRWLALALVGPIAPPDAQSDAADGLDGRQVFVAAGRDDSAAEGVVALLRSLPLLRVERRGEPQRGLALLRAAPRLQSDLLGWLFAVTPRR